MSARPLNRPNGVYHAAQHIIVLICLGAKGGHVRDLGAPRISTSCLFMKRQAAIRACAPCVLWSRAGMRYWSTSYVKHALMAYNGLVTPQSVRCVQQYGCSMGRARLGTGTLGPASGLRPHWSKEPSRQPLPRFRTA